MIVVADTSILINLCCVGQGGLLRPLFQDVVIPPDVAAEFNRLAAEKPRFTGLVLPEGIREQAPAMIESTVQNDSGLDRGEAAALSLALEVRADAVLIDERHAHAVARKLGLRTIGILGIFLQAKSNGLLTEVLPVIEALERDAGFWMSASLRHRVLTLAGE